MRPLADIISDLEQGETVLTGHFDGGCGAAAIHDVLPLLKMIVRQDTTSAQKCLDVMFAVLSRVHSGEAPKEREALMEWARQSLRNAGIDVLPMGLSHAVIRKEK
jgi:hypothetical protein